MTVLILATRDDITVDRVLLMLTDRGTRVVRCDTADIPHGVSLHAQFERDGWVGELRSGPHRVELADITAIWNRSTRHGTWPATMNDAERRHADLEVRMAFGGVLTDLPVRWINHPAAQADADFKPRELRMANRCGLTVPESMITSDPTAARAFAEAAPTVIKPLGSVVLLDGATAALGHTHLLTGDDLADLSGIDLGPHFLQRWVDKDHEVRLTAVGDQLFAARIHAHSASTRVDWRTDPHALTYEIAEIPDPTRVGVIRYLEAFGLRFAAFDFVVRPDGEWVFLEANTCGQFGWIEHETGSPISRAIVDELTDAADGSVA